MYIEHNNGVDDFVKFIMETLPMQITLKEHQRSMNMGLGMLSNHWSTSTRLCQRSNYMLYRHKRSLYAANFCVTAHLKR